MCANSSSGESVILMTERPFWSWYSQVSLIPACWYLHYKADFQCLSSEFAVVAQTFLVYKKCWSPPPLSSPLLPSVPGRRGVLATTISLVFFLYEEHFSSLDVNTAVQPAETVQHLPCQGDLAQSDIWEQITISSSHCIILLSAGLTIDPDSRSGEKALDKWLCCWWGGASQISAVNLMDCDLGHSPCWRLLSY